MDRLSVKQRTAVKAAVMLVSLGFLILFFVTSLEYTASAGTLITVC